ncbi:hypothetical protein MVEN_02552200 [Mycena venus]|uniref:Uncharacterized protein n=1 Tax=Mycena venus TaxID=2733690 RepID=A0A8H6WST2_9AGAR|nr:hypothetical protein MVEN_02552200 [Mycena venus]
MFHSNSHIHVTGGNFVNVGGDFNVQSIPPSGSVDEVLTRLEFRVDQDRGRQLRGPERTESRGLARPYPYDDINRGRKMPPSNSSPLPPNSQPPAPDHPVRVGGQSSSSGSVPPSRHKEEQHLTAPRTRNNDLGLLWNRTENAPSTNIHGGTFIGGNVTNIHRHDDKTGLRILHSSVAGDAL